MFYTLYALRYPLYEINTFFSHKNAQKGALFVIYTPKCVKVCHLFNKIRLFYVQNTGYRAGKWAFRGRLARIVRGSAES